MRSYTYSLLSACFLFCCFLTSDLDAQWSDAKVYLGRPAAVSRGMSTSPFQMFEQDWFRLGPARLNSRQGNGQMARFAIGVFFGDRFLLKSDFIYQRYKDAFVSYDAYEINPTLRYYFSSLAERTFLFSELGFSYLDRSTFTPSGSIGGEVGVGLTHLLAPTIALDAQLTYHRNNISEEIVGSNYLLSAGLGIVLGNAQEQGVEPRFGQGTLMFGLSDLQFGVFREDYRATTFSFQPQLMYFFSNRLAFGVDVQFDFDRIRTFTGEVVQTGAPFSGFDTTTSLAVASMLRYQATGGQRLSFFFEAGGRYRNYQNVVDLTLDRDRSYTESGFQLIGNTGFDFFITENVALEFGPEMAYDFKRDESDFFFSTGFQVFLRR